MFSSHTVELSDCQKETFIRSGFIKNFEFCLEYNKQNIQSFLNTNYVITANTLFLFELELLSRKFVILLKLHQKPSFKLEAF